MKRALHFIAIDLGVSLALTCGLMAFWLFCMDAETDDVAALTQKASANPRAIEYVEALMTAGQWPSHGQLIVAQATVSELLKNAPEAAPASPTAHKVPWQAYAPLLMAHLFLTALLVLCIQRLRRSKRW